jgi:hypothetical protein
MYESHHIVVMRLDRLGFSMELSGGLKVTVSSGILWPISVMPLVHLRKRLTVKSLLDILIYENAHRLPLFSCLTSIVMESMR